MEPVITAQNVAEAAEYVSAAKPGFVPRAAIILGSGLGQLAGVIENATQVPYEDVPHMPASTVDMHAGCFELGFLSGVPVVCMHGRIHAYEGYTAQQLGFPVHVMASMGAKILMVTNAAGGINAEFGVGDLMLIEDHINFQMMNPCIGMPGDNSELGPRFFDMTCAYSPRLRKIALEAAEAEGITLQRGVYIGDLGPSFETPAEIRAFRAMGADAVGMSTVQEVIAARQRGLEVLGISLISNPAAGVCAEPLDMSDVARAAVLAAEKMQRLALRTVAEF